ncbi:Regulatory protein [Yarrowia sp. C11]|nr:Regulatory protein [Yarrowia sp. E02]KAG5371622.1 Regulatory protein [Yarrowia sp. C11]
MTTYDLNYDYSFESLDSFDYLSESQVSTAATSPGVYDYTNGASYYDKVGAVNHKAQVQVPLTPATPLQTPRQSEYNMITPATIMSRAYSTSSTPFVGMKLNFETPMASDAGVDSLLTPQSISMDRSHSLPETGVNPFYAPFELNQDVVSDAESGSSPTDSSSSESLGELGESGLAPPLFTNPFYKPQSFVKEVTQTGLTRDDQVSLTQSPEKSVAQRYIDQSSEETVAQRHIGQSPVSPVAQRHIGQSPASPQSMSAKAAKLALSMVDEKSASLFKSPEVQNLYSIIHTPHTPTVVPHNGVLSVSPEFEFTVCEKKFVCKHCEKRFKRHEHLKRHMKIHTDDRPFCCDIEGCGRKFSRSDNFRAHRRTHMKKGGRNSFVEGLQDQYTHRQKRRST